MTNDRYPDIKVENHGSIFLFHPLTDRGAQWIGENVDTENAQFHGQALAIEHRYAAELSTGMIKSGLRVI